MIGILRSPKAPAILSEGTSETRYRDREVVEQLYADFFGKCYICEIKPLQSAEVEHLRPHKNGTVPGLKFDWNNLFLACRHCNSVKNQKKYDNHIIDCCRRDPEMLLDQSLVEGDVRVRPLDRSDVDAALTAELIEETFMSSKTPLRSYECAARISELQKVMNLLYTNLLEWQAGNRSGMTRRTLKALLTREAKFAGFTRCYVRNHLDAYPELECYLT